MNRRGPEFAAALGAAAAAFGGDAAHADQLPQMMAKLKEAKSPGWVEAMLEKKAPLSDQESLTVKELARTLVSSDEIQIVVDSLKKLVDGGKMKQNEAISLFMDITREMDRDVLETKVSGIGANKSTLSEAIATAIATTESDGRYRVVTHTAPDSTPTTVDTPLSGALAKSAPRRPAHKK